MPQASISVESRLPGVGTTIFTVMSALATECGAINLSQGFPDFSCDPRLMARVAAHMQAGHNQYAPMAGVPALRQAIVAKVAAVSGTAYDPDTEVTVTAGATQALHSAISALVRPGDEVVVFEPVYDSYVPAIELNGGRAVRVPLTFPEFAIDWAALDAALTPRTRLIIVNTPHNPTASILSAADLDRLAERVAGSRILLLGDEVYEHIVFDGAAHRSLCGHPELAARSLVVSSFGKTFHITGWKIGSVVGPATLMAEFRKVHQYTVFCVNTPLQWALADYLSDTAPWQGLPAFYQQRRDVFREALAGSRFTLLPCAGTYFQLARYDAISDLPDTAFAEWLTRQAGVAAIPLSPFHAAGSPHRVVRFCFAKGEDTLREAGVRLGRL